MTIWSNEQALDLWERGLRRHALDRALLLASAPYGGPLHELAELPISVRDQILLGVHAANFGPSLPSCVDCPACATRLEFTLAVDALQSAAPAAYGVVDGMRIRPASSRAVALALQQRDPASARRCLAQCCVAAGPDEAEPVLTDDQVDRIESALAEADGAAEMLLELACEQCGHAWSAIFDIAAYLWRELDLRARTLLRDIHVLARAYGWSERGVLALSDERRAVYIGMAAP